MLPKSALIPLFAITCILAPLVFTEISVADNASFTLQPMKEHTIMLALRETDDVSGSFSVVSDDETGVNFFIADPYNNTLQRFDDVIQKSFSFTAESDGDYQLHFDNLNSTVYKKTVSLNYYVIHYIMGMPQEQFLFVVIAAAALAGLVLYAVLMRKQG